MFIPKKSLSQNFLTNTEVQLKVINSINSFIRKTKNTFELVEIGPGQGDLTQHFLAWDEPLLAIEIDQRAIDYLEANFKQANFKLIQGDALEEFEKPEILNKQNNYLFLSNLPFNPGSRIMVEMATFFSNSNFAVILQKEVCKKTVFGIADLTFFGAWLNFFWNIKYEFTIKAASFKPKPKVDTALIFGTSKNQVFRPEQILGLRQVLKALFVNPRKTLLNNLKNLNWSKEKTLEFYQQNNYSENIRLTWLNYQEIIIKVYNFEK
jgi:16S rRNA (adenine1518-N6/adenine1519-N6)-dimethyltransferase